MRPFTQFEFAREIEDAANAAANADTVGEIVALLALRNRCDEAIHENVADLRSAGHSWARIAVWLKVSPQAVQQRFGQGQRRLRGAL